MYICIYASHTHKVQAYRDIIPVLSRLARALNKSRADLRYASISVGLFCHINRPLLPYHRSLLPYNRSLLTLTHMHTSGMTVYQ